jgi:hypothetical protein
MQLVSLQHCRCSNSVFSTDDHLPGRFDGNGTSIEFLSAFPVGKDTVAAFVTT